MQIIKGARPPVPPYPTGLYINENVQPCFDCETALCPPTFSEVVSIWRYMPWFHFTKGLDYNVRLQTHETNMAQDEPLFKVLDMFVMESCICYP